MFRGVNSVGFALAHNGNLTNTFFGSYCQQIMAGATGQVSFAYGSPGPGID